MNLDDAVLGQPASKELETNLLGYLLANPDLKEDAEGLQESDFAYPSRQKVFHVIKDLWKKGIPADRVTVQAELKLDLMEFEVFHHLESIAGYVKQLKEMSAVRKAVQRAYSFVATATKGEPDLDAIALLAKDLSEVYESNPSVSEGLVELGSITEDYLELKEAQYAAQKMPGVVTGIRELDRILGGGLQPTDLIVVAARPSGGKTALVGNSFAYASALAGHGTALFNMEMNNQQFLDRLMSQITGIDGRRIRSAVEMNKSEFYALIDGVRAIDSIPLFLDESRKLSHWEISSRVKAKHRQLQALGKKGIELVIADQTSFIEVPVRGMEKRERVGEITKEFKRLAGLFQIPVVLVNQLRRQQDKEGNELLRKPVLTDLKESGSLEEDADVVIAPWRPNKQEQARRDENGHWLEDAFLCVLKQRNGPCDFDVPVIFNRSTTTFLNP